MSAEAKRKRTNSFITKYYLGIGLFLAGVLQPNATIGDPLKYTGIVVYLSSYYLGPDNYFIKNAEKVEGMPASTEKEQAAAALIKQQARIEKRKRHNKAIVWTLVGGYLSSQGIAGWPVAALMAGYHLINLTPAEEAAADL